MEEGIAGAIVEGGILDVLADDARTLLVAAAEEIGADVMIRVVVDVLTSVAAGLGHDALQESVRAECRVNGPLPALTRDQATRPGNATLRGSTARSRSYRWPLTKFASLWRTEKSFSTTLLACRRH
jgi:hypothetical protein